MSLVNKVNMEQMSKPIEACIINTRRPDTDDEVSEVGQILTEVLHTNIRKKTTTKNQLTASVLKKKDQKHARDQKNAF